MTRGAVDWRAWRDRARSKHLKDKMLKAGWVIATELSAGCSNLRVEDVRSTQAHKQCLRTSFHPGLLTCPYNLYGGPLSLHIRSCPASSCLENCPRLITHSWTRTASIDSEYLINHRPTSQCIPTIHTSLHEVSTTMT